MLINKNAVHSSIIALLIFTNTAIFGEDVLASSKIKDIDAQKVALKLRLKNFADHSLELLEKERSNRFQEILDIAITKKQELEQQKLNVFERNPMEADINRQKQDSLSELGLNFGNRQKFINTSLSKGIREIGLRGEVNKSVWTSITSASSLTTPLSNVTTAGDFGLDSALDPNQPTRLPNGVGIDNPPEGISIVQVHVPESPQPKLGKILHIPLRIAVHNSSDQSKVFTLGFEPDVHQTIMVRSRSYRIESNETKHLTWLIPVDLREQSLSADKLLGAKLTAFEEGLAIHQKTVNFSVIQDPSQNVNSRSSWEVGIVGGGVTHLLKTRHLVKSRRQIIGMDVTVYVKNQGLKDWEAPLIVRGYGSSLVNRDTGSTRSRSVKRTIHLEKKLAPGDYASIILRFGSREKKFQLIGVMNGPPQPPGTPKILIPAMVMTDAFSIVPNSDVNINVILESSHDEDLSDNQIVIDAHISANKRIGEQNSHIGSAPNLIGTSSAD